MNRKALITTLALIAGSPIAQSADTAATTEFERALANPHITIAAPQTDAWWQDLSNAQDRRRGEIVAELATKVIEQGFASELRKVRSTVTTADRAGIEQMRRDLLDEIRLDIVSGVMADRYATLLQVRRSIADANRQQTGAGQRL